MLLRLEQTLDDSNQNVLDHSWQGLNEQRRREQDSQEHPEASGSSLATQ